MRQFGLKGTTLTEKAALEGRSGGDGKLVILGLATGKRLYEWAFDEQLGGVAITTDGRHVAVGLATGVIYVLRIDQAKKPG